MEVSVYENHTYTDMAKRLKPNREELYMSFDHLCKGWSNGLKPRKDL